jgi:hypothetical protein
MYIDDQGRGNDDEKVLQSGLHFTTVVQIHIQHSPL